MSASESGENNLSGDAVGWAATARDPSFYMSEESQPDPFQVARRQMVESQLRARGIRDLAVLHAMETVPRHEFVSRESQHEAYADHPLPIGEGQTISQPYIVAVMLEAARIQPQDRVLEIGAGSGYMAALLGQVASEVYSVERHVPLAESAQQTLWRLGYRNVMVLVGDGSRGLAEYAPFDAIVVSAAAPEVPTALSAQLAEAGRMIIPVGPPSAQRLLLIRKRGGGLMITGQEECRFVPLIGTEGYSEHE